MPGDALELRPIDIEQGVNFLEDTLGKTWLKDNLKKLKNAQGGMVNFGCGISTATANQTTPRVAYWWYKAREEINLAAVSGQVYPGHYALLAATLGQDLATVQHCQHFDLKLHQLRQYQLSEQVIFELSIAAGYVKNNHKLDFTDSGFKVGSNHILAKNIDSAATSNTMAEIMPALEHHQLNILYLQPNTYPQNCRWHDQHQQWCATLEELMPIKNKSNHTIICCTTELTEYDTRHQLIQKCSVWNRPSHQPLALYLPFNRTIPA